MEALPFVGRCFALVTAAGSLNYCNVRAVLEEAARVLEPGGQLVIYDFSVGRRFRDGASLAVWFEKFLSRYPRPEDGAVALDPRRLTDLCSGLLGPAAAGEFTLEVPYEAGSYADYLMTETNVAAAVQAGETLPGSARGRTALSPVCSPAQGARLFSMATLPSSQSPARPARAPLRRPSAAPR